MPHKIVLMLMIETEDDRLDPEKLPAAQTTEAHRLALMQTIREAHPGEYELLAIMGERDAESLCQIWMQIQQKAAHVNQQKQRPKHWSQETSGILRAAVMAYLEPMVIMTPQQIGVMREYFALWMQGDWQGDHIADLRSAIKTIANKRDIRHWLERAVAAGLDPL